MESIVKSIDSRTHTLSFGVCSPFDDVLHNIG